jgi:hypothetical protein
MAAAELYRRGVWWSASRLTCFDQGITFTWDSAFAEGAQMRRSIAVAAAVAVMGVFVLASPAGASASAALTVPITLNYDATFEVTPGVPSPCDGVPITDTATGTGSHLGRFTATYPHCVNFAANTFSGTARFKASNGDLLLVLLGGSADDPTCTTTCGVSFTGTIVGGTGRFEGADRTLIGTGTVDLIASTITAAFKGTINKESKPC